MECYSSKTKNLEMSIDVEYMKHFEYSLEAIRFVESDTFLVKPRIQSLLPKPIL